jgi:hypothetical protein
MRTAEISADISRPAEISADISRWSGLARSGWLPAALVSVLTTLLWIKSGVSVVDVLIFSAYLVLGVCLPGVLIWRRVWGDRPRPFATDLVVGFVIGLACELAAYLVARGLGVPRFTMAWSAGVLVLALVLPKARRLWRAHGYTPMPSIWSWGTAACVGFVVLWLAGFAWWNLPLGTHDLAFTFSDEQSALALVGELRHHVPPQMPWVSGEQLHYHWYAYAHIAASSWSTGLEPVLLLRRLSLVPMVALTVVGASLMATQVSRRVWAGPACAALLVAVGPVHNTWMNASLPYGQLYTDLGLPLSPTQTFGTAVFTVALMLCLRALSDEDAQNDRAHKNQTQTRGYWVVVALVLGLLAGSKSTFLPILLAGLVTVILGRLVTRRPLTRPVILLFGLTLGWLLFAQVVLYAGSSRGMKWAPLDAGEFAVNALHPSGIEHPGVVAGLVVLSTIVAIFAKTVPAVALAARGGWQNDRVALLLGSCAAGLGAYVLLGHIALSQAAFARGIALPACVAAVWALSQYLHSAEPSGTRLLLVIAPLGLGALVTYGLWATVLPRLTRMQRQPWADYVMPPLIIAAVVLCFALIYCLVLPDLRSSRPLAMAAAALALIGSGALYVVHTTGELPQVLLGSPENFRERYIERGGVVTARWLRSHSNPDDLLATNEHRTLHRSNRMFWLSAFSERRVLVEGWGYSERINSNYTARRSPYAPFWDRTRLDANNDAFRHPSVATVAVLANTYGVRWMVFNRRVTPGRARSLSQVAQRRFARGEYVVYEIRPDR